MYETSIAETTRLLPKKHGIPDPIPDNRILCERAAFYSLVLNLVSSLSSDGLLHWSASHSSFAAFLFSGISNISAIIFAIISDGLYRRAITISTGFVIYLFGYAFAIAVTNPSTNVCIPSLSNATLPQPASSLIDEPCARWILPVLSIIAIGSGAIQSNMAVFGAEQTQKSKATTRYFDQYLIAVNTGGIIGSLMLSFIQKDIKSYFVGYSVAAGLLLCSFLLFIIGYRYYLHVDPIDTVVRTCYRYVVTSLLLRWQTKKQRRGSTSSGDETDAKNSGRFTDRMINDIKSFRRALLVFSLLIPYFLIYNQISSTFPLQGEHMWKPAGVRNIVTLMILADPITLIIGLAIIYLVFYRNRDLVHTETTIHRKFLVGMFLACIAMLIAGTLEKYRRETCDPKTDKSSMSIYYLLGQNICMGLSEVFAMLASFEYAYFAAPRSAQSLFMSLRFVSIGIASFIGSGLINLYPNTSFTLDFSCRAEDTMDWAFYCYFFIIASVQFVFFIIFYASQSAFHLIEINPQQIEKAYSAN
ncbi:unnamed protein product [Adineta ricciae]|uniref:Uncharacterized protein n=1 Tax=Adineta ricciae TaxID=249248 RepID=A0A815BMX1_ADIRI|nr:unnamed protein product [Adineta ricciae]CAF1335721.1 unnamed protein product [Adineta ricciae]